MTEQSLITEEESLLLAGYHPRTRRYFLSGALICLALLGIVIFFQKIRSFTGFGALPTLFLVMSLMLELWWRSRRSLKLLSDGLLYGEISVSWDQITRYTTWGPVGVPLTPLQFEGLHLYTKANVFTVAASSPGYPLLLQRLKKKCNFEPSLPTWYNYPASLTRIVRYLAALIFTTVYILVLAFKLILVLVVLGYGIYRIVKLRKRSHTVPADTVVTILTCLISLLTLMVLFESFTTQLVLGLLPVMLILWFPWQPNAISIIDDTLLIGKKKAYPIRHLRAMQVVSRFWLFKVWRLNFANGTVEILTSIEDFQLLKKDLEALWEKQQQQPPLSEEEYAEMKSPQQEAKRFQVHFSDSKT